MNRFVSIGTLAALLASGAVWADDYREVWECTTRDGKTLEDVQAVNSKWLAWMRRNVDRQISSAVLTAVVGDLTSFVFVDTYPSLEVWSNGKSRQDANEEMDALEAEFDAVAQCGQTRLWRHRPTP